ncbi:ABC transporter permease subunit [Candidatus Saccharibacteria bacterium]|nr:ABC transporter permease subunit [Candidatus Saccharibacteria bacterium]
MMMAIVKWTLWQRRWAIFWWSLGIAVLIVLNIGLYPSFHDQSALNQQLQSLPEAARSLFSDTSDFFSPQGYLSSQIFYLMLPLLLGILTIGLGSSLVAKEEDSGTLELLLSRPVSRGKLLAAKAFSGLLIALIVAAVALISSLVMAKAVNIGVPLPNIVMATATTAVLAILFGALALTITTLGRSARLASLGLTALVALGSYIVTSLSNIAGWLDWPSRLLPYHYFKPGDILYGQYHWPNLIGLLAAVAVLMFIAWRAFRRRDLGS